MFAALRCAALTRSGRPCRSPAVAGSLRCRMHGGGAEAGAPLGNRNALRSGRHTREAREERRAVMRLVHLTRGMMRGMG
jgi:glucans biosynthesis protein